MNHPIVSQAKIFKLYALVWIILSAIHAFTDTIVYSLPLTIAITDSLIFNVLMFTIGLSIWFPVLYIDTSKGRWSAFTQHSITGVVVVTIWLFVGKSLLDLFVPETSMQILFSDQAFTIRAIVGGLQFMLYVMVYYMFIFYSDLDEKNRQQERLNRSLRESELNALKSQLNPHFLFNSLNSISSLTITEPDDAREMINKLSDFLRYSLKKNENALLPLRDELKNMSRYMEIEKVRFGDRLQCEAEVPKECKDLLVPVLILQPLYENAVKYGVHESIEPVTVRTFCRCLDGELEISVINNFDKDAIAAKKGTGVGLNNVKERLFLLYNRKDLVSHHQENGHFEVTLRIPQKNVSLNN
ncbi:sensor histidine kinase [Carboxylicivirga sp. N1Y90]|uniref:sensor histidine kinase n=1 Tax=Carboxylicivirga fragile TaxID=3417571 RepID=UPI003D3553F6|nr:histidine kinase [Marinilabiliaceae bacterium N1Y90]